MDLEGNEMKKRMIIVTLFAIIFCVFTACDPYEAEEVDWENIRLGELVPKPQSSLMRVRTNNYESLSLDVYEITQNMFWEYSRWCENDKKFIIDLESIGSSFSAYNSEGYHLQLRYTEHSDCMSITLDTPIPYGKYELPEYAIEAGLPLPKSNDGYYKHNTKAGFLLYVGKTTEAEHMEYIAECKKSGFVLEPYEYATVYSAKNADGFKISVKREGFNTLSIDFDLPAESEKTESNPE